MGKPSSSEDNNIGVNNYIDVSRAKSGHGRCGTIGADLEWVQLCHRRWNIQVNERSNFIQVGDLNVHTPMKLSTAELRDRILKSSRVKEALQQGRADNRMSKTYPIPPF